MSYIPSFVIYTLKPQIFILTEGDTLGGAITDYIYLPQTTRSNPCLPGVYPRMSFSAYHQANQAYHWISCGFPS